MSPNNDLRNEEDLGFLREMVNAVKAGEPEDRRDREGDHGDDQQIHADVERKGEEPERPPVFPQGLEERDLPEHMGGLAAERCFAGLLPPSGVFAVFAARSTATILRSASSRIVPITPSEMVFHMFALTV